MVVRGRVQNSVVVLDDGVSLPNGQEVSVLIPGKSAASLSRGSGPHSVLDIPTVKLGPVLRPITRDNDLLDEMLEGRP